MLVRVEGILEFVGDGRVVLAHPASGIAREVLVAGGAIPRLAERVGERVTLHTIELYESQGQGTSFIPRLLGFETPEGRRLHELLTTVRGVGPRKALRIMAREAEWIASAIARADVPALRTLPEVGPKLAETIIRELAAHAAALPAGPDSAIAETKPAVSPLSPAARDAVGALVSLGQLRREAEEAVRRTLERTPELATPEAIIAQVAGRQGT